MEIKIKGLNIQYKQGRLGFLMTEDAIKEFCNYHKYPFDDNDIHTNGTVTTKKLFVQTQMVWQFSKIVTNNWRKRHGIPMKRRIYRKKELKS